MLVSVKIKNKKKERNLVEIYDLPHRVGRVVKATKDPESKPQVCQNFSPYFLISLSPEV